MWSYAFLSGAPSKQQIAQCVIAATNHPEALDRALFRRFDGVLWYNLPDAEAIVGILRNRLSQHVSKALERKRRLGQYAVLWQMGKLSRSATMHTSRRW